MDHKIDTEEAFLQHRELQLEADRLTILAHCPERVIPDQRLLTVWEQAVGKFSHQLRDHFAFEERGGYMADVLKLRPGLQHEVTELKEQHHSLSAKLEQLLGTLMQGRRQSEAEPPAWATLRLQLKSLLESLEKHERAETALMQRYLCEDLGGQ